MNEEYVDRSKCYGTICRCGAQVRGKVKGEHGKLRMVQCERDAVEFIPYHGSITIYWNAPLCINRQISLPLCQEHLEEYEGSWQRQGVDGPKPSEDEVGGFTHTEDDAIKASMLEQGIGEECPHVAERAKKRCEFCRYFGTDIDSRPCALCISSNGQPCWRPAFPKEAPRCCATCEWNRKDRCEPSPEEERMVCCAWWTARKPRGE